MYSQSLEEKYILEYFGDYVGTFLDIGCNDCLTFSNTRALALNGWKGVFIDPSPKAMQRCKVLYNGHKGYYFYEVAISDHNGNGILQESGPLCSAADVGLVSTFHHTEMERFKRTVKYEPIEVKTFKWKTFSNRLKSTKINSFDFISLDIESDELNVLPDMDLSKTRAVCIEWNSKPELKSEYDKYLNGFKVIYTSSENLIYAR
jgi:FkbM family methyltransferase